MSVLVLRILLLRMLILDAPETRRLVKTNSSLAPFLEFGSDIFGDKDNLRRATNQLVFLRCGLGSDEREDGSAVRRRDREPAIAGLKADVKGDLESKLVAIETQAPLLIAHEDVDAMDAKVLVATAQG